jgi:phosphoribosylaminoimidazole-succinocarboxamide synthase
MSSAMPAVERRGAAPKLPPEVVDATSRRYLEAYRRLTGEALKS